jgi:penicillin-binding protein 2
MKCHDHPSPINLYQAIMTSCNAYFCSVLRNIMDEAEHGGSASRGGYDHWAEHVRSFGFGRKLDSDFTGEASGNVYGADYYDKRYSRWNSLTVLSLAIGPGELGCSPLQMANFAATIANRGHYFIPHVIKEIEGVEMDPKFSEPHYTDVSPEHYEPIVEGMHMAALSGTVSGNGYVPGLDICGKTGTAQNPHGKDHSVFLGFAPKNDPKIAIYVYVENAGFGASTAVPIGSLLMEQYLTDTVKRPYLVNYIKEMKISYPNYDNTAAL